MNYDKHARNFLDVMRIYADNRKSMFEKSSLNLSSIWHNHGILFFATKTYQNVVFSCGGKVYSFYSL
jgi:hypothetical protein